MKKSPLTAHNASTWVNCTGSVKLSQQFPRIETGEGVSEAILEGRAFHEVAEIMLLAHRADGYTHKRSDWVGTLDKGGTLITDEIFDGAVDYVDNVKSVTNIAKDLQIESRVDLSCIYPEMYGYADAWLFDEVTRTLYVWDAKFGHRRVDAFENWQLICYAFGLVEQLLLLDDVKVSLRVSQPRSFRSETTDEWLTTVSELRQYFEKVKNYAFSALQGVAVCKTGKHCTYCPARYACTAAQQSAYTVIDYVNDVEGVMLTGDNLATELRILKRAEIVLQARLSGLEEQALAEIRNGGVLNGFIGKTSNGRKRWKKDTPVEEVIMMGDLMGVDVRKPVTLDTPAQVLKKGVDASVIDMYSETPVTGLKLVEDNGEYIRNMFKEVK